jgi:hypothetical protein
MRRDLIGFDEDGQAVGPLHSVEGGAGCICDEMGNVVKLV